MRIFDLARIAVKSLTRWAVLPAAAAAIGVFCMCVAGTALAVVQQEKSQPFELSFSSQDSDITENDIANISEIEDVKAVTPVFEVPASVAAGDYSAELNLIGIYSSYLTGKFKAGGVFPESGVMPYIVLNEAACKEFKSKEDYLEYEYFGDETDSEESDAPDVDWLQESIKIMAGEGKPVTAKISGILSAEEEDEQPAAYISVTAAKGLLPPGQQGSAKASARITNIGCAEKVSRSITALGFNIDNTNDELQAKWDSQEGQIAYLLVISIFSLLCFFALTASSTKISMLEHKNEWQMLKWTGLRDRDLSRIFIIRMLVLAASGILAGIIAGTSLPSFLDPDPWGASVYTLPVPFWVAAASGAVFLLAGVAPSLNIKKLVSYELDS
ncbi:MAG: FtsX-like permease family protein [Burkholderiales bacterium]